MENKFERATREQVRFETTAGQLTVEDLWELPLSSKKNKPNLDTIAIALKKKLNDTGEVKSFVDTTEKKDDRDQLAFDLVKHIIDVRLAENKAATDAKGKAELKQKLLAVLQEKEDGALKDLSADELRKKIEEL